MRTEKKHRLLVITIVLALVIGFALQCLLTGCSSTQTGRKEGDDAPNATDRVNSAEVDVHNSQVVETQTAATPELTSAPTEATQLTESPEPTETVPVDTPIPVPVSAMPFVQETYPPMTEMDYVPGYTTEQYVNVRAEPSTEADILRIAKLGTAVYITGRNDDWFKVEIDGVEGYIARPYVMAGQYVTPSPILTPKPTPKPTPSSMYTVQPGQFSEYDIKLVAALIHAEGPGSTKVGYRAIASVILNRVLNSSRWFPNDVPGVLFQKGQFGYSRAYLESLKPNSVAIAAARYVFQTHGSTLPKKVLFYRAAYLGRNWTDYTKYYATIEGNCYFYGIKYY